MKALKTALDKLAEEGAGFAEEMGHGLLDAFLAVDLLGRYHVRLEAIDAGWQAPPEPVEFSEIATEAMTPEAAIEFFRTKTTLLKVPDFVQLAEKYRQRAFTIAWVEEIELLEASKGLLESFLADDRGLDDFRKGLGSMFDRAGVTRLADWHTETVFRTNMQTAYNAGRWDELMDPEMVEFFPMIEYHAVLDDRTRPTHRAMHGTRLPRDDPFWEVNWPPNGFSCRCGTTALSVLDDPQAQPPPTTITDDEGRSVAVTADPGFAHNPGTQAGWENTEREIAAKAMDNGTVVRKLPDGSYGPERVLPGMRSERVRRLATPEDWVDELPPTGMIPPEITPVKPARPRIPKVAPSPQLPPAGMIPDDILPEKIIRLKKEPPIPTETAPQLRFQDMDRIGPRAGSNPGGLFQDPTTGEKWYIKTPQTEEMARNEVLASKLYEVAGVEAPQLQLLDVEGRMGVASRWIEDLQQGLGKLQDPAISGIGDGFAVDAWLANWDVAGLEFDNLLVSGSRAVRVDVGGALRFRAQGSLKGSAWGKEVKELETLLDASVNPQSAQVFSGMTREELLRGMKKVIAVPDKTIRNLVDEFGPLPDAERKKLKSIIIARKKFIEARAGELRPGAPAIVQVPANAAKLTAEELSLAKTARQNGHALRFDAGDVEDQSLLVWQETGREGQDIFLARLKLRPEALDRVSRETGALAAEGFKPAPIATKLREIRAGFGKQAGGAGWQAPEGQFFRHASENLEMTLTRREDTFMTSWWGVVDIEASTAARLEDGLDTLRRLGVDVSRPGDLAIEELHLRQIITHMGKDPGEIGPAKSIGARVKRLRKTASRLAGVDDITALPDYSPQGIDQAFGNGPKLRMRPDMVGPKWDTFFREHRLTHAFSTGQSTANIMDAILNSGGNLASTMERLRMGVKWADTMSPLKDMQTGGASYTFTRVKKFSSAHNHPGLVFRSEMLKRLDSISYNEDLYGDVSSPKFIARNRIKDIAGTGESHSFSHSNETIFKNTVSVFDSLDRIVVSTVEERLDVIAVLKKHGISEWPDGRSLDDVVKVVGSP